MKYQRVTGSLFAVVLSLVLVAACSASGDAVSPEQKEAGGSGGAGGPSGTGGSAAAAGAGGASGMTGAGGTSGKGGAGGAGTGGTTGSGGGAGGGPVADAAPVVDASVDHGPAGPKDGDPSKPVVSVPSVPCGAKGSFGLPATNVQIGGRDVFVSYPCNKHEGAPMTVMLLLHGTMDTENLKLYIVGYFGAANYVDTDNLIVLAPKAIGSQWGNGDNGADQPHLFAVLDWAYSNFAAFDLRSLWIAGHSWGAFYAKTFVCNAQIQDKVHGVVAMSGGPQNPMCINRVSHIHTIGEKEIATDGGSSLAIEDKSLPDQSAAAAMHGCENKKTGPETVATARYRYYAHCDPQWVHSDYVNIGKAHADSIDAPVVEHILDSIKATDN
jgi:hypothetical protein